MFDYIQQINPAQKKRESEMLSIMYQNWRASGGVPTVITKELLRSHGPQTLPKVFGMRSEKVVSHKKCEPWKPWELVEGRTA